jgi:hypothetical protein
MAAGEEEREQTRLVEYLLGRLPEPEQIRLEAEYLGDAGLQERLILVEDDLVDSYAQGALSADERLRLEEGLLASPRGRRKLALASALGTLAARSRGTAPRRRSWARAAAVTAAGALLVLALIWVLRGGSEAPQVALLSLRPGVARGAEPLALLDLPRRVATVEVHLELDRDDQPRYRVSLLGQPWRADHLVSRAVAGGRALVFELPAALLPAGEGSFIVSGDDADDPPRARYGFMVRR